MASRSGGISFFGFFVAESMDALTTTLPTLTGSTSPAEVEGGASILSFCLYCKRLIAVTNGLSPPNSQVMRIRCFNGWKRLRGLRLIWAMNAAASFGVVGREASGK
ncbi:hypothetical protein D3C81_1685780 [compost metagenome]